MESLYQDGSKRIQLSKGQFQDLNKCLRSFYQKTKCLSVILCDASGLMLAKQGHMESNNFALLSTLAAADYAATLEMSKILGEENGFKVHFHEGKNSNLYLTSVNETCYLIVVFSKNTTFGMVRVQASKSVQVLREVLLREFSGEAHIFLEQEKQKDREGFEEELSAKLDSVLSL